MKTFEDIKKHKRLGIIGGLDPETGFKFCLNINNRFKEITNIQPDIVLENLPISEKAEQEIINGDVGEEHLLLLKKAVERMNHYHNQIDLITIPCNTVHVFIDELRNRSRIPILSIIEECALVCKEHKLMKIGLLASTKTINERLHEKELEKQCIIVIKPKIDEQNKLSKIILKIIKNETNEEDKEFVKNVINNMKQQGAEAIALGCTTFSLLIGKRDSPIPIIDSLEVLENSALKFLL